MDLVWFDDTLVFAGPDTEATVVTSAQGRITWALRFPPGVAHALLDIAADNLVNQRVELRDLANLPASALETAHADPAGALDQIAAVLWHWAEPDLVNLRLAASLDRAARAGLGVRAIAQQHGLSERSLRRLSDRVFGYGPKTLSSIHRLQHALRLARSSTSLGEAAAVAGYADQAHLSQEARRLTGTTLRALIG